MPRKSDLFRPSFWGDDDRIGYGGFEAPNGRRWNEPPRNSRPSVFDEEMQGEAIGYLTMGADGHITMVITAGLESFTDSDDQDWQNFCHTNKK